MNRAGKLAVLALSAALGACGDSGTPPDATRDETALKVLRFRAGAPSLVTTSTRFWAKKGEDREVSIFHHARAGRTDSTRFLRFKVPGDALDRLPSGATIARGDSVLITITVVDPSRALVRFEPSGLKFGVSHPARLKFEFEEADDDLDGDGDTDAADTALLARVSIWRQEQSGLPWLKLGSLLLSDLHEIEADISSFTNYAVAY